MAFGDVFSIVLAILLTITTTWAGIVAFSVLFSARARVAATALTERPGRQIGVGLVLFVLTIAFGASLAGKTGPGQIAAFMIVAGVLAIAVLGSSGLALVVAERLRALNPKYTALEATARGAALCVAVGLIPVIGWFFLFPVAVWASLGAGLAALIARKKPEFEAEKVAVPAAAEI